MMGMVNFRSMTAARGAGAQGHGAFLRDRSALCRVIVGDLRVEASEIPTCEITIVVKHAMGPTQHSGNHRQR